MSRIICVTGTDTEVGKTVVTEALAVGLRADGLSVIAIKPVESGTAGPARPSRGCPHRHTASGAGRKIATQEQKPSSAWSFSAGTQIVCHA